LEERFEVLADNAVEERLLGLMTFVIDEDGFAGTRLVPQRLRNRRADRRLDDREISGGMPSSLRAIFVSRARTIVHRPSVDDSPPRATYGCRSNAHRPDDGHLRIARMSGECVPRTSGRRVPSLDSTPRWGVHRLPAPVVRGGKCHVESPRKDRFLPGETLVARNVLGGSTEKSA